MKIGSRMLSQGAVVAICLNFFGATPTAVHAAGFDLENARKSPEPVAEDRHSASQRIKDAFKLDYENAKTGDKKLELARKLFNRGLALHDDDAARFVLLRTAKTIAVQQGNVELAFQAIDGLDRFYEISVAEMKREAIDELITKLRTPEESKRLLTVVRSLADEAVAAERLDLAKPLLERAATVARKTADTGLVKDIAGKQKTIQQLEKNQSRLTTARATLEKQPDDPRANLTLGEYLCFVKDDWEAGLSHLAKSSDAAFKSVADRELTACSSASEQLALADAWFEMFTKRSGHAYESQMSARALHWYSTVAPRLSGLEKAKVDNRLEELAQAPAATGPVVRDRSKLVFLDDLPEAEFKVGFGVLGKRGQTGFPADEPGQPQLVKFRGEPVKNALSTHPQSEGSAHVIYQMNQQATTFFTGVGVFSTTDAAPPLTSHLTFKVFGDGRLLWESKPVSNVNERQDCRVSLVGVQELKLQVDCSGHAARCYAVWLEPSFVPSKRRGAAGNAVSQK